MFEVVRRKLAPKIVNAHESVHPIYIILQIVGLSSYKWRKIRPNFVLDKIAIARTILQFVALYCLLLISYLDTLRSGYFRWGLGLFVVFCGTTIQHLLLLINFALGLAFTRRIIDIMNGISTLDVAFRNLNIQIKFWYVLGLISNKLLYEKIRFFLFGFSKTWYWSASLATYLILTVLFFAVLPMIYFQMYIYTLWDFCDVLTHGLLNLVNYGVLCQYSVYSVLIGSRYKALNDYLGTLLLERSRDGKLVQEPIIFIHHLYNETHCTGWPAKNPKCCIS